jgi:hypothetical protein
MGSGAVCLSVRQGRKRFLAGFLIGMAPDLLSFGFFHVTHPEWITLRFAGKISGAAGADDTSALRVPRL